MAGVWIKWVKGLAKRPEVLQMAHMMGRSRHEVAGLLCEFWEWADDNVDVRNLSASEADACPGFVRIASASNALVDTLSGAEGFAEAMSAVGWLIVTDGALEFPRFTRHNGNSAKRRALDAERKRTQRAEPGLARPQTVRKLSACEADEMRTREEKRREENTNACSEPAPQASEPSDSSPIILTYPCTGKVKEWHLREDKLQEYRESFPFVDVLAECRKALQWCRDNARRQKTARGMMRFLGSWLAKEQDRGGVRPAPGNGVHSAKPSPNIDAEMQARREKDAREREEALASPFRGKLTEMTEKPKEAS